MGLDLVELTMVLEDEFGIQIADKDAAHLTTPGLVADYIFARVNHGQDAHCLSQVCFYALRRALVERLGIDRKAIRVDVQLKSLLGSPIRAKWRQLGKEIGGRSFPRLQRHGLLLFSAAIAAPAILMLMPGFVNMWPGPEGFMGFLLLSMLLNMLTLGMGTRIPRNVSTVGALVPYVRLAPSHAWSRQGVLEKVMELTSLQLGIPLAEIREHSHFVADLGAD